MHLVLTVFQIGRIIVLISHEKTEALEKLSDLPKVKVRSQGL
jgi:hypothetical protein